MNVCWHNFCSNLGVCYILESNYVLKNELFFGDKNKVSLNCSNYDLDPGCIEVNQ